MIYDVAIIGAGPAGLMAARTAAGYGLKAVLFEKKKEPAVINRACTALFYLKWVTPDAYLEPVTVEKMPDGAKFHWPALGLSVNYSGPLVPYSNAVWISPGGVKVHAFKNELFAYYFDKEVLIDGLIKEASSAGAQIRAGASGLAAENTGDGVKVTIRNGSSGKTETVEARWCIAADGVNSVIVDSLGLNEKRRVFLPTVKGVSYVMEGVDCPIPESRNGHLTWMFPDLPGGRFMLDPRDGDKWWVAREWETLRQNPQYAPWFQKARVLKKAAFSATVRTPLREPVAGRVLAVGDAAAPIETWVQGSLACGYRAAKAIAAELDGRRALDEYTCWWQHAFYFNDPGYFKRVIAHHLLSWNKVCSAEEIDYIYRLFENERVVPTLELARRPQIIRKDRPELYKKVVKTYRELMDNASGLLSVYPKDAAILHDPEAHLKRWPRFRL